MRIEFPGAMYHVMARGTYLGGNVVSLAYTPRSQVATIGLDGTNLAQYEYNPVGKMTAKNLENGTSALFVYDAAHRLTGIEHRKGLDLLASFAYTLDSVGNRKGRPICCEMWPGNTADASGNRQVVSENATSRNYIANALNQYTSVGGSPFTYDANANGAKP